MWSWLQSNAQVVSAAASLAMLVVWAAYLQLIYSSLSPQSQIHDSDKPRCWHVTRCKLRSSAIWAKSRSILKRSDLSLDGEEAPRLVSLNDLDVAVPTENRPPGTMAARAFGFERD